MNKKLSDRINKTVAKIGMKKFENPIFYNSPTGIRFEISEPFGNVFLNEDTENKIVNEAYLDSALHRAKIYITNYNAQLMC